MAFFNLNRNRDILVYTLLVKNELDIILDNIFFHFSQGVDKIIVTDNGSTDGTLEILQSLDKRKIIKLYQEKFYNQDKIVNQMGRAAKDLYGATILIHSDADEFWKANNNNLKQTFIESDKIALSVARYDVLPVPSDRDKAFPYQKMSMLLKHLIPNNIKADCNTYGLFLFKTPPKIMFSVKDTFKKVGFGNHTLVNGAGGEITDNIMIFHFPFKSSVRFEEKVIQGGRAFMEIETDNEVGWHWKRWHKIYNQGKLDEEIARLTPDISRVKGVHWKEFDYNQEIISRIKTNKKRARIYAKYKKTEKLFMERD